MSVSLTVPRRLAVYGAFAASALLLGIVLGAPALVALGAPFGIFLVLALAHVEAPRLDVRFALGTVRAVEGERLDATVEIANAGPATAVELLPAVPTGIAVAGPRSTAVWLEAGESRTIEFALSAERWGAYRLGETAVRARDRFGLISFDAHLDAGELLRVYPASERLRSLVNPGETQPYSGNRVARTKGDGIEFADIRPFVRGDRVRRINWRAMARRQAVYVNEAHPERNSDVVLFVDSFAEVGDERRGTLDLAVRAAASLAREYLERRDRVGVVSFGGIVRWLGPSMGRTQIYRIVDALLETEIALSFAWKGIDVLPPRSLPPQALVIALSPLLDERSVSALLDLRSRGFDLVIVDVSPLPFAETPADETEALAHRLWPLWRRTLRYRYERHGVAVLEWTEGKTLAQLIAEGKGFRRYARHASG